MNIIQEAKKIFFEGTAVYISADFMDIAEAHLSPGGIALVSIQRFPLAKGPENGIDGVLDRVFSTEDQIPYRVAVNVKNDQLILRRFSIREIPEKELEQAIVFAVGQHLPCPIDTLTYGFKTYRKTSNYREIIFFAADTKNINELASYFMRKHILPAVIEPVPLLLSKLVSLNDPAGEGACILAHYEPHNKIILCGIANKHPYFSREITISTDIGPRWKDEDKEAYPTLGAAWPYIEEEIVKSINYLRKESGGRVEKMYISGFSRSGDEARISKELNMPIERHRFPFFTKGGPDKDDRYLPLLMLVLDSLKKPCLNIAPVEVSRSDMWGIKFVLLKFFIGLGVIIALHMAFLGINARSALKTDPRMMDIENYGIINPSSPKESVDEYKKSVIESASFAGCILAKKRFLTQKLTSLSRLIPPMAWVESLTFSYNAEAGKPASLTVKGAIFEGAPGSTSVNKILEALEADKDMMEAFKNVSLSYVEKKITSGREVTEFEISFK